MSQEIPSLVGEGTTAEGSIHRLKKCRMGLCLLQADLGQRNTIGFIPLFKRLSYWNNTLDLLKVGVSDTPTLGYIFLFYPFSILSY